MLSKEPRGLVSGALRGTGFPTLALGVPQPVSVGVCVPVATVRTQAAPLAGSALSLRPACPLLPSSPQPGGAAPPQRLPAPVALPPPRAPCRPQWRLTCPVSFITGSPSILPLTRRLFMAGWEGLMASCAGSETRREKAEEEAPRHQAGAGGGTAAQQQTGPPRGTRRCGVGVDTATPSSLAPNSQENRHQGPDALWAPRVPPGQPEPAEVRGLGGVLHH